MSGLSIDIGSFFCYKRKYKELIRNKKLILKTQQKLKSKKHNVFPEVINKIVLSLTDDKRMRSADSTERYEYRPKNDLVIEKSE